MTIFRPLLPLMLLPMMSLYAVGGGRGNNVTKSPTPDGDLVNTPLTTSQLKIPSKSIFHRIIQARVYHQGTWTLTDRSQTPMTVGRTLASLRPGFVTGLLRVSDRGIPGNAETEAYESIRSAIRETSKDCRFDVVVDAGNETSETAFVRRMQEISMRIHVDAWTFYLAPENESLDPDVIAEAISYAHSKGQMAGYDGPLSIIPEGVDYIVVRAWNLEVNRNQIEALKSRHIPLIVELPTTFGSQIPAECSGYVEEMDASEKGAVLTRLAAAQSSDGYRFAYPVFYPLFPAKQAYDATKEPLLMVTIRSLLARFN